MLIGELVRQTGVSRDTIRYYEKQGLLQPAGRPSPFNNYKAYPATTVTRLALIQQAKKLGFTLAELAELLPLWENQQLPSADLQVRVTEKLAVLDEKIRQLETMRARLRQCLTEVPAACCP